jgi:MraZ protein
VEENGKDLLTLSSDKVGKIVVTFIGEYTSKLDDKGRLVFPAPFKGILPPDGDMRFVVKKDIFSDCLEMYTFEEWQKQSEQVKSRLNFFNEEHAKFWREYMRNRSVVEPDPKFGRITISRKLLDSIGITKEAVFSGNDYKIEIWAKEKYEASAIPNEEYIAIAGKLSEAR